MLEKGFLLDMDGTLADTLGVLYGAYCELLYEFKAIPTYSEFESLSGGTIEEAIHIIKSKHSILESKTELMSIHRALYSDKHMRCPPTPGAVEFLEVAHGKGIPCCLVTSASDDDAHAWLQHSGFAKFFEGVISGSCVGKKKPHPEPYLMGAEQIALAPSECIALEDSASGISAALSAGCRTFSVGDVKDARITTFPSLKEAATHLLYD